MALPENISIHEVSLDRVVMMPVRDLKEAINVALEWPRIVQLLCHVFAFFVAYLRVTYWFEPNRAWKTKEGKLRMRNILIFILCVFPSFFLTGYWLFLIYVYMNTGYLSTWGECVLFHPTVKSKYGDAVANNYLILTWPYHLHLDVIVFALGWLFHWIDKWGAEH